MTDQEAIKNVFDKYGPVLRSKTLRENGFYNQKLQKLIDEGVISHVRRGYYILQIKRNFQIVCFSRQFFLMRFYVWNLHFGTMVTLIKSQVHGIWPYLIKHQEYDFGNTLLFFHTS